MVARLDHQKGIDIALSLVGILNSLPARLILHGSGDPARAHHAACDELRVLPGRSLTCPR